MIPFKIKLLTPTAKAPTRENEGDLWDLYADEFCATRFANQKGSEIRLVLGDSMVFYC